MSTVALSTSEPSSLTVVDTKIQRCPRLGLQRANAKVMHMCYSTSITEGGIEHQYPITRAHKMTPSRENRVHIHCEMKKQPDIFPAFFVVRKTPGIYSEYVRYF